MATVLEADAPPASARHEDGGTSQDVPTNQLKSPKSSALEREKRTPASCKAARAILKVDVSGASGHVYEPRKQQGGRHQNA